MMDHEQILGVTVGVAIFSVLLSVCCVYVAFKFWGEYKKSASDQKNVQKNKKYFSITSHLSIFCNVMVSLSVSLYSFWIIFEPEQALGWFIALRSLPTIFWFVGKTSLIWLYNGRYYYTFARSMFKSSYPLFLVINGSITILAPTTMLIGYLGVWYNKYVLISIGFEGFRFLFLFFTLFFLILFSKKMLLLQRHNYESLHPNDDDDDSVTCSRSKSKQEDIQNDEKIQFYMDVTTRNAVLVLFISISSSFVAFWWIFFDYIVEQSYLTLLCPMDMFSIDSVIDSLCIYLLFSFSTPTYDKICSKCDKCCRIICSNVSDSC